MSITTNESSLIKGLGEKSFCTIAPSVHRQRRYDFSIRSADVGVSSPSTRRGSGRAAAIRAQRNRRTPGSSLWTLAAKIVNTRATGPSERPMLRWPSQEKFLFLSFELLAWRWSAALGQTIGVDRSSAGGIMRHAGCIIELIQTATDTTRGLTGHFRSCCAWRSDLGPPRFAALVADATASS